MQLQHQVKSEQQGQRELLAQLEQLEQLDRQAQLEPLVPLEPLVKQEQQELLDSKVIQVQLGTFLQLVLLLSFNPLKIQLVIHFNMVIKIYIALDGTHRDKCYTMEAPQE